MVIRKNKVWDIIEYAKQLAVIDDGCVLTRIDRLHKHTHVYAQLVDYMRELTYDEILTVEALMLYGRDIEIYGEDGAESLAYWLEYVQDEWGGDKGNADDAIAYITGKLPLSTYLEIAMNALEGGENENGEC